MLTQNKFKLKKVLKENNRSKFKIKISIKINLNSIMKDTCFINKNHLLSILKIQNTKIIGILWKME
jgi:hypothetical protein